MDIKVLLRFISLSFFLIILGCSPNKSISDPYTLKLALQGEPSSLNPYRPDAYTQEVLSSKIYESLLVYDDDTLTLKPRLAERWTVSPDKLSYTFYLRHDVYWHDGAPFDANDVVKSFDVIKDEKNGVVALRNYVNRISKVTKIDDYTVRFDFSEPYFMALEICGSIHILPSHLLNRDVSFLENSIHQNPIGTGPFRFLAHKKNRTLTLVRNEMYWGKRPDFKKVVFKIILDGSTALQIFKKGDLDVLNVTMMQWIHQTENTKDYKKIYYQAPQYNYIGWNNASPFFEDARVRQAMTYFLDRDTLVRKFYFGLSQNVIGPFYPQSKQYHPTLKPLPYDPSQAKVLLSEAGWRDTNSDGWLDKNGKIFEFSFLMPSGSALALRIANIYGDQLATVGIKVKIETLEWGVFLKRLYDRKFDATLLAWSANFSQDPYEIFDQSQADVPYSSNFIYFKDDVSSKLIRDARSMFDETTRNGLYHKLQERLQELQPYTFLFSQPSLYLVQNRFENIVLHKTGIEPIEWRVKKNDNKDKP